MGLFDGFIRKIKYRDSNPREQGSPYEFCPRCEANLTLQNGYNNELPYWVCKGCGEMLINPEVPGDNIAWICDQCEAMLNVQDGFFEECGEWKCLECGYVNRIDKSELYLTDAEYQAAISDPYRGLSDESVLELSMYTDERSINNRDDIVIVKNISDGKLYVKKILSIFDVSVYNYLKAHPIPNMPKICGIYESKNSLILIEEYIFGQTLLEIINENQIESKRAVFIAKQICNITTALHELEKPIIHRDIKPSNVMIGMNDEVYLLDMNVAKWYKEDETEDTKLLGTKYYAAPEQLGYGLYASSDKTDIYAIGMLLNVMVIGKLPKEEKAPEPLWSIIEKCICLEPNERFSDRELLEALDDVLR